MEIKFLGTGGAFEYTKGTSSALVTQSDKTILIDCGATVFGQLRKYDLMNTIDYVLITHMHGDHVGCLFQYIYYTHYALNRHTNFIYTTEAFKKAIIVFLDAQNVSYDYYSFIHIDKIQGLGYIDTTGMHSPDMIGHAYYFTTENELIYYSGDIGNIDVATDFLTTRKEESITVFHEISKNKAESHVYYKDAMEKLSEYTAYGYHCDKATIPADNTFPLVEDYPELHFAL
jgi:ribonuclease BN (tRNA processing enzyme)